LDGGHLLKKSAQTRTKKGIQKKKENEREGMKYRDSHKEYDVQGRTCLACFYISLPSSPTNLKL
jgi:hypothetical protein